MLDCCYSLNHTNQYFHCNFARFNNFITVAFFFAGTPNDDFSKFGWSAGMSDSLTRFKVYDINNVKDAWFRLTSTDQPIAKPSGYHSDKRQKNWQNMTEIDVYFGRSLQNELYPPPAKVSFKNINGSSVQLCWLPPEKRVQSYEVAYALLTSQKPLAQEQSINVELAIGLEGFQFWFKRNNLNDYNTFIVHGNHNQTVLNAIQPGLVYDVRIRARYGRIVSVWASTVIATNAQDSPGQVSAIYSYCNILASNFLAINQINIQKSFLSQRF